MDSMNKWFGKQLRRELVKLMVEPSHGGPRKHRTNSLDSQRLSLDSLEGFDGRYETVTDETVGYYHHVSWANLED